MTPPFKSRLAYLDRSSEYGKFTVMLLEDLKYEFNGEIITVPARFMSDFATIPQPFQWLISKVGPYNGAAVVHDWGYCVQRHARSEVDAMFLEIM